MILSGPLGRQQNMAPATQGEPAAAEVADRETGVVAEDGAAEPEQGGKRDVEPPGARVNRSEGEDGLARYGPPESSGGTSPATAR